MAQKVGLGQKTLDLVLTIIRNNVQLYSMPGGLIHGDFGLDHVFVKSGEIVGVIDFENAKSGDPYYDFAWWSFFQGNRPSVDWLIKGYEEVTRLDGDYESRMRLNRLHLGLDLLLYFGKDNRKGAVKLTISNLNEDLQYFYGRI